MTNSISFGLIHVLLVYFINFSQNCLDENFTKFKKINEVDVHPEIRTAVTIRKLTATRTECLVHCRVDCVCWSALYNSNNTCHLYNNTVISYLRSQLNQADSFFYIKHVPKKEMFYTIGLTNYWLSNSPKDVVNGKYILNEINVFLSSDRLAEKNSATELKDGYLQLPAGNYFWSHGFTLMIWIKFMKHTSNTRILEFGNGMSAENFLISYTSNDHKLQASYIGKTYSFCILPSVLNIGQWYHLSVTSELGKIKFLVDNNENCSFDGTINEVIRSKNYIGGSVWLTEGNLNFPRLSAVFNEFKVFNRSLTVEEILVESDAKVVSVEGQLIHILDSKRVYTFGLVHYWPIAGSTYDIIGRKDLQFKLGGNLAEDRFGNLKSAFVLNFGYGIFPSGKYFYETGSTLMFWIKPLSYILNSTVIINFKSTAVTLVDSQQKSTVVKMNDEITDAILLFGEWTHVAITSGNNLLALYLNGKEEHSQSGSFDDGFLLNNYLGHAHMVYDELKIFNRKLSTEEIKNEKDILQPYIITQK